LSGSIRTTLPISTPTTFASGITFESGCGRRSGLFSKQRRKDGNVAAWTRTTPVAVGAPGALSLAPVALPSPPGEPPEVLAADGGVLLESADPIDPHAAAAKRRAPATLETTATLAYPMKPDDSIGRAKLAGERMDEEPERRAVLDVPSP
jgi:hypothetical protein